MLIPTLVLLVTTLTMLLAEGLLLLTVMLVVGASGLAAAWHPKEWHDDGRVPTPTPMMVQIGHRVQGKHPGVQFLGLSYRSAPRGRLYEDHRPTPWTPHCHPEALGGPSRASRLRGNRVTLRRVITLECIADA